MIRKSPSESGAESEPNISVREQDRQFYEREMEKIQQQLRELDALGDKGVPQRIPNPEYLPDPQPNTLSSDVAKAAKEIEEEWTDKERLKRLGIYVKDKDTPRVHRVNIQSSTFVPERGF